MMIALRVLQILLILCFPFISVAQHDLSITRKTFKTDVKEGFSEAWIHVKEGDKFFTDGTGTYSLARDHYLKAHQYNSEHPALNLKIGICYLHTDDKYEAIKYIRKVYDQTPNISNEIHYHLGRAYHLTLEFEKAIFHYSEYKKIPEIAANAIQEENIDKLITECSNGQKIIESPKRVIITNLGSNINSPYDDYFPIFSNSDSVMYFTSRRPLPGKSKRNPFDNKYYENIYVSYIRDGEWQPAGLLFQKPKKSLTEAAVGFSPDGATIYLYRGKKNGGDVYQTAQKNGKWQKPKPIAANLRSKDADGSVFFTPGNDTIYLVSASGDLTRGGKDIMMAVKNMKNKWQKPVNIGSIINTKYEEEGVFLNDGNEIYFSSKGHNNMGGFDIFRSYKRDDGTWADPENFGYPVNTPDDDLFFSFSIDGKYGYYSTIREGGIGGKDIYMVTFLGSEKDLVLANEDIPLAGLPDIPKAGFFSLPLPIEIDSSFYLTGQVLNKETSEPVLARLEFIDSEVSKIVATGMTSDSGYFRIKFSEAKKYGVEIKAIDYLMFLDAIDMTGASSDEAFVKDFYLEKIEIGSKVILENIYFETNRSTLSPASYIQLNQVIEFMKSNSTLRLEISGHTDNVGSLKLNTKLSEDRAKAVVDYLSANGITPDRLEWKGYAFSQPVVPNDTPEGRERNRRVEFKVIGK